MDVYNLTEDKLVYWILKKKKKNQGSEPHWKLLVQSTLEHVQFLPTPPNILASFTADVSRNTTCYFITQNNSRVTKLNSPCHVS